MENKQVDFLYKTLDDKRHENGDEYWHARDLYPLLGYKSWDSFLPAIERAKESIKSQEIPISDHFRDVKKMTSIDSRTTSEINDIRLTRYASYLIALNGDTRKKSLQGKNPIKVEHMKNNKSVRNVLEEADIRPEELPAEEDIKKIKSRHEKEKKLMERRQKKELESLTRKK